MGKIQKALHKLRTESPHTTQTYYRAALPARPNSPRLKDHSIRSARTLEIDWERLADHGLLAEHSAASEICQQYQRVKRPLLRHIFETYPIIRAEETGRVLLVASALRGDGKSFTSLNLALAIAIEPDLQVLLIDGDVPKQALTNGFDLEDKPGILDLAADESVDVESCIYKTSQDSLYFMPAGRRRSNSPELLGSLRTRNLLSEVAQSSGPCVIIIDSPPVLLANEARALSSAVDQTVFVVCAGITKADAVDSALEAIGGPKNVYMLLNQATSTASSDHHYGYGYGYGAASEDSAGRGG